MSEFIVKERRNVSLKSFDSKFTDNLSKKDISEKYESLQKRLIYLQDLFCASKKFSLLIILQGMDCSGKDGTVKKLLGGLNPNGFTVESFKEPSPIELSHDYLWRIHKVTPKLGDITVFNRSYYEDVLITRVHGIIDEATTFRRFKEINNFESYLIDNKTIILKFFLNISKDFQKEKLKSRLENPEKHWKFSSADLKERKYWDMYQNAYEDVFSNCSTEAAPWHIVPADNRWFRDYVVLKTVVKTLEDLNLKFPPINGDIKALMQEVKEMK